MEPTAEEEQVEAAPEEVAPEEVAPEAEECCEVGVQVMPMAPAAAAPVGKPAAAKPTAGDALRERLGDSGDLAFLRDGGGAQADLLAAVSAMLPHLDRELAHSKAVQASAEPLLEVLKRCQRAKGQKRQKRR